MCLSSISLQGAVTWLNNEHGDSETLENVKTWIQLWWFSFYPWFTQMNRSQQGTHCKPFVTPLLSQLQMSLWRRWKQPWPECLRKSKGKKGNTNRWWGLKKYNIQSDLILYHCWSHCVQGVRVWKMQTLGLSSLCSNHLVDLTDSAVGPACLTGTAWWLLYGDDDNLGMVRKRGVKRGRGDVMLMINREWVVTAAHCPCNDR